MKLQHQINNAFVFFYYKGNASHYDEPQKVQRLLDSIYPRVIAEKNCNFVNYIKYG